jgi:cytidylate kinase
LLRKRLFYLRDPVARILSLSQLHQTEGRKNMPVITIARQFGAGGRTLGLRIAKELQYRFLDDVVIAEIAKKARVTQKTVQAMEREAGGMISRFISAAFSRDYIERITGAERGYLDEKIYVDMLTSVIPDLAAADNVVLLGRGGQYFLKDDPGAWHFLLVADMDARIQFMQQFYNLSDVSARQEVLNGEKRRAALYRRIGKQDYDNPEMYHMVLNMSRISLDQALHQICMLVTGKPATMAATVEKS